MKRLGLWLVLACSLTGISPVSSAVAQQEHEVHMYIQGVEGRAFPEFYFEPTGLYIEPGDTVRFIADTPHHTATAYHQQQGQPQRVPEGVEPFSSPVVPIGDSWEYTFDTPGVYDIWCAPHEVFGMVMRIVVGEASGPGAEPAPLEIGTPALVLNDPALDPENIISAGTVSWEELAPESKLLPPFLRDIQFPEPEGEPGEEAEPGEEDEIDSDNETDDEEGEEGN
jgi:plastocyanin